mmetsp:Transcript_53756/g.135139  ORF Transcript_53756/g.135139 Transcript_53756/m.135139 type:complete len:214 (+) Transcript_53756:167-808(+)
MPAFLTSLSLSASPSLSPRAHTPARPPNPMWHASSSAPPTGQSASSPPLWMSYSRRWRQTVAGKTAAGCVSVCARGVWTAGVRGLCMCRSSLMSGKTFGDSWVHQVWLSTKASHHLQPRRETSTTRWRHCLERRKTMPPNERRTKRRCCQTIQAEMPQMWRGSQSVRIWRSVRRCGWTMPPTFLDENTAGAAAAGWPWWVLCVCFPLVVCLAA